MQKGSEIIAGVDVGTTKVVAAVAEVSGAGINMIGVGDHPCKGLNKGIVVNIDSTASSIRHAVEQASQQAGCRICCVYASVSGQTMSRNSTGMVTVRGKEVEKEDVERVLEAASSIALPQDRRVIHILPQEFIVDGQDGVKNPIGMCGVRLETKVHLVTAAEPNLQNLTKCFRLGGLEVEAFVLDHLAGSMAVLQEDEKELGVAYVDIGGSTVNIIIYIDESVMYTVALPVGSMHVTKDIAVGLNTPLASAEILKRKHGHAVSESVDDHDNIEVPMVGGRPEEAIARKSLCRIIQPRTEQIIDYINRALQQSTLLPALASGVVLGGGGSILPGLADLAHEILDIPVRVGSPYGVGGMSKMMEGPQYAAGVGLVKFASGNGDLLRVVPNGNGKEASGRGRRSVWAFIGEWFKEII